MKRSRGLSLTEAIIGSFLLFGLIIASFTFFSQVVRSGRSNEMRDVAEQLAANQLAGERSKGLVSWDPVPSAVDSKSTVGGIDYLQHLERHTVAGFEPTQVQEVEVTVRWSSFGQDLLLCRKVWVSESDF